MVILQKIRKNNEKDLKNRRNALRVFLARDKIMRYIVAVRTGLSCYTYYDNDMTSGRIRFHERCTVAGQDKKDRKIVAQQ